MRRAARVDRNQSEIVTALRSLGCSVQPLHTIGSGCPDLLIGIDGQNLLIEVKDGAKKTKRSTATVRTGAKMRTSHQSF
jgi:Holliday junction resolvase